MTKTTCFGCILAVCLSLAAAPAAAQMSRDDALKLARQYQGQLGTMQTEPPEPVALTESDVTRFITTVEQLRELGVTTELHGAKTDASRMARALAANDRVYGILKSNQFTRERFHAVAFSVGLAMAVVEGGLNPGEIDSAVEAQTRAMEQLKGRLTQQQIDAIAAGMATAGDQLDRLRDQPPGNQALVRTHLAALKQALGVDAP